MNSIDYFRRYVEISGDTDSTIPTYEMVVYLDGYKKGLETLDKMKEEISYMHNWEINKYEVIRIIEKYMKESEV